MFKDGRDLGMLMISANWLGLEWLLWEKGNQRQTAICLEPFYSPLGQRFDALFQGSHTCMPSAFCSIIHPRGVLSIPRLSPAGAQRVPAERPLRAAAVLPEAAETMGSHSWEPRWHWHGHCHPAPPPRELLLGNSQPPDALRLLESGWTHFNHFLH